jgi:hypothetical protein
VGTTLDMPLYKVLVNINDSHWSRKHPSYPAYRLLIFDNIQNRLRLKVTHEYVRFPRLCDQLYRNILQHKTVNLQPFVWPHIMVPPRGFSVECVTQTLKAGLTDNIIWNKFAPQQFRQYYQHNVAVDLLFSKRTVKFSGPAQCTLKPEVYTIALYQVVYPPNRYDSNMALFPRQFVLFVIMLMILSVISWLIALQNGNSSLIYCNITFPWSPFHQSCYIALLDSCMYHMALQTLTNIFQLCQRPCGIMEFLLGAWPLHRIK